MFNSNNKIKLKPGEGKITLTGKKNNSSFSELEFSYPLKLISPNRIYKNNLKCLYLISYGGGLIGGDSIKIRIRIKDENSLILFTQGSTKIFQSRIGIYESTLNSINLNNGRSKPTIQNLTVNLTIKSSLYLLPSPITCFIKSNYKQKQIFNLDSIESNLLLLDWYTSGRSLMKDFKINQGKGEEWLFTSYESINEIYIQGKRVVKDVLRLKDTSPIGSTETSYRNLVEPYSCYATLYLFGPTLKPLLNYFKITFEKILQFKLNNPYDLIWSFSELEEGQGGVIRCGGISTERVREWLVEVLEQGGIEDILGRDLWLNALS